MSLIQHKTYSDVLGIRLLNDIWKWTLPSTGCEVTVNLSTDFWWRKRPVRAVAGTKVNSTAEQRVGLVWSKHFAARPSHLESLQQLPTIMRTSSILTGVTLLLAGASALEKPLDIEVTHAVECSKKTKAGEHEAVYIHRGPNHADRGQVTRSKYTIVGL